MEVDELNYDNLPIKRKTQKVRKLAIVSKPSVKCPFNNTYVTIDRCVKCCNYGRYVVDKGVKIACKYPY